MDEFCQQIQKVFKYDVAPNAINFNEYRTGSNSLYWHADDEELFVDKAGNTTVLFLSVGATRLFQILRNGSDECDAMNIELEDGMFLEMAKKTQLFYKHQVLLIRRVDLSARRVTI
jgi:alkylated DNA repair dioxygenase AlkB